MKKEESRDNLIDIPLEDERDESRLTGRKAAEYNRQHVIRHRKRVRMKILCALGILLALLVILAVIAVIAGVILKKTPFGWHVLSIGGNEKAAKLSGVKVDKVKIWVYAFSGFCSAIVGIIATSQLVSATPKTGESWEMNAIAASVLGGTSMAGGVGSIGGTIIGAFVIGVINDGMTMCGVTEFWQKVIRGLVIIIAVIIDQVQRNLQAKMALQARNENK